MGREHNTYYFDRNGQKKYDKSIDCVVEVTSVEHDTYGRPSYSARILDIGGAQDALPTLKRACSSEEYYAINDAIRSHTK